MSLGGRYESFRSDDGYFSDDDLNTPNLDLTKPLARARMSFRQSFRWIPTERSLGMRYSFGRAFRFPIVEKLFSQYRVQCDQYL